MKKFLCFAVAACLAVAPLVAFADNGEYDYDNGYEYEEYEAEEEYEEEYENGNEYDEEYDNGYEYEEEYEAEEEYEEYAYEEEAEEEAEQTAWTVNFSGEYDTHAWEIPVTGSFTATASVELDNATIAVFIGGGDEIDVEIIDDIMHFAFEAEAGNFLMFFVRAYDEEYPASAIIEVNILLVEEEAEEVYEDEYEAEEYDRHTEVWPYDEEEEEYVEEYLPTEVRPIDSVRTWSFDKYNLWVPFREVANAYGYFSLSWDGATGTVTVNADEPWSFVVEEIGGYNIGGTIYVPIEFALERFEG